MIFLWLIVVALAVWGVVGPWLRYNAGRRDENAVQATQRRPLCHHLTPAPWQSSALAPAWTWPDPPPVVERVPEPVPEPAPWPDEPPLEPLSTGGPDEAPVGAESVTQAVFEPSGEQQDTETWSVPQ